MGTTAMEITAGTAAAAAAAVKPVLPGLLLVKSPVAEARGLH